MVELEILSPQKFTSSIEEMKEEMPDLSYIECVIEYCEKNMLEVETVSKLLTPNLKEKIAYEAENLNFLPKTSRLPV